MATIGGQVHFIIADIQYIQNNNFIVFKEPQLFPAILLKHII